MNTGELSLERCIVKENFIGRGSRFRRWEVSLLPPYPWGGGGCGGDPENDPEWVRASVAYGEIHTSFRFMLWHTKACVKCYLSRYLLGQGYTRDQIKLTHGDDGVSQFAVPHAAVALQVVATGPGTAMVEFCGEFCGVCDGFDRWGSPIPTK